MPLNAYGVLKARAVARRREGATNTPHYQVQLVDDGGTAYRIAVNVQSQQSPSELLYRVDDDLRHPLTDRLAGLAVGWHPLAPKPNGGGLDFIRGNLFDPTRMRTLPPDRSGPDNDLADLLDHYVERAIADPTVAVHAFGERWGPEVDTPDAMFGFRPGNGVHDIHMNQGNSAAFTRDDGVWQDGGLLLHFPAESRWVGIFLAFQSQAWHTDDATGRALAHVAPSLTTEPTRVRIVAAMVNPVGPAPERESVLLLNASPDTVDLTGWRIADAQKHTAPLPSGPLAAGETLKVVLSNGVALGNRGGAITVLDAEGRKVAGVSYTGEQVRREGWTVTF
jgi:uncharacterized protein YukJ